MHNIILLTDSYKCTHYKQYPPGTNNIYSYFESRIEDSDIVFFGLQYYLMEYLNGVIVNKHYINDAYNIFKGHFGRDLFNYGGWLHILNEHGGKLPLSIKAVAEGTVVPSGNVLMTVENTCNECYWLTNYIESLLVQCWYPCSVATNSRNMKKDILSFLGISGDQSTINYKLHDFGFRGVSSVESAGLGGLAHLVNFFGTDTVVSLDFARKYYNCNMAGNSIPASEHSTITSWGISSELESFSNMLNQYKEGLVACVSDSYNIYRACEEYWGTVLKDVILNRDGCLIIRPDSGDPVKVIIKVLEILGNKFGFTINSKGFKLLNPHVRVIQGDGIDSNVLFKILFHITNNGWSIDNVSFGSGGGLLQKLNRDTYSFAFKCSAININNEWRDVYKEPIDMPLKNSKRGRLKLINKNNKLVTVPLDDSNQNNQLREVFRNGDILIKDDFDTIRERAAI